MEEQNRNYQSNLHLVNKPIENFLRGVSERFQYQLKKVRLVDICQRRSNSKMKGLDKLL